jgi:hypothetical protein
MKSERLSGPLDGKVIVGSKNPRTGLSGLSCRTKFLKSVTVRMKGLREFLYKAGPLPEVF